MLTASDIAIIQSNFSTEELDQVALSARKLREWFRDFIKKYRGKPLSARALSRLTPLNELLGLAPELDNAIYQQIDQMPPQPFQTWIQGFYHLQNYPMGLLNLGLFSMKYDQYMEARLLFLKGLKEAGGGYEEIYFNLAVANFHLGNLDLGRLCLQDTLQLDPSNSSAIQMLNNLNR